VRLASRLEVVRPVMKLIGKREEIVKERKEVSACRRHLQP
jgi:hypothetical protein